MIEFYTAPTSNGQRVGIMLEECAIPYRLHVLDLFKGEHRSDDFLRVNPAGQIPAIVDPEGPGGTPFALGQSGAIMLYLAEKAGRFVPIDSYRRAVAHQWFMLGLTDVAAASGNVFLLSAIAPEKSEANVQFFAERTLRFFRLADAQLADREYLADELSIADFALYPLCVVRRSIIDGAGDLHHLTRWCARMAERPAVSRAMQSA